MKKKLLKNNCSLFLILILITIFLIVLNKIFLQTDELIISHYSEELAYEQAERLIETQKKWQWLGYFIIPLLILVRSYLVTISLSTGMFFYEMENKIKYKQIFKVALYGEFILISVGYVKLFYFKFLVDDFTFVDIQQFYPLSFINFFNIEKIEPWLVYPLQTINLFEIGYFLILVYGLNKLLKNNYWRSFEITAVSYGTGLLIWIGLVMFLTLNLS